MPHYIIQKKHFSPVLVYEAPVDEKTKKVREMFEIDEKTGYAKHYNWLPQARLGKQYRPEDPFLKFDSYDPEKDKYSKFIICGLMGAVSCAVYSVFHVYVRPAWTRPWYPVVTAALGISGYLYYHDRTLNRQQLKDAIYVDYLKKHPERFETIYRPKLREVLFYYVPIRT